MLVVISVLPTDVPMLELALGWLSQIMNLHTTLARGSVGRMLVCRFAPALLGLVVSQGMFIRQLDPCGCESARALLAVRTGSVRC